MDEIPLFRDYVRILYTNYRNETGWRTISPQRFYFGSNEYHKEEQWLLDAFDVGREVNRTFAMQDIQKWEPCIKPPRQE